MPELKLQPMSDVAKPGTTPAEPTSKPVVLAHETVIDPMVKPDDAAATAAPADATEVPAATETGTGSMKSKLTPSASAADINKEVASDSDKKLADEATKKSDQEMVDEKQARLAELIESGEFNVPVGGAVSGSNAVKTFIATVAGIVGVAAIALFLLTDLGILDLGVKLPFHIFNKAKSTTTTKISATAPAPAAVTSAKVTFPTEKINFTYDPTVWKFTDNKPVNKEDYGVSLSLLSQIKFYVPTYISLSEFNNSASLTNSASDCANTATCTDNVSDFSATKIEGIIKSNLYLYRYIKKSTSAKSTRPFSLHIGIGKVATQQNLNDKDKYLVTIDGKVSKIFGDAVIALNDSDLASSGATLEEAQALINTDQYKAIEKVLLSGTDQ